MAKINITKPTGDSEIFTLLSAFKIENTTYIIFDSERIGSMGLPIIYISKYTNKLEKITDANEWQSVKNYLKGIINGANFEYVKVGEQLSSDEVYYTPLTLPAASFDVIKSRYIVKDTEDSSGDAEKKIPIVEEAPTNIAPTTPIMPNNNVVSNTEVNTSPVMEPIPVVSPIDPVQVASTQVEPVASTPEVPIMPNVVEPIQPVPPIEPVGTNISEAPASPAIPEPIPAPPMKESVMPVETPKVESFKEINNGIDFDTDKETFLKACENMFDALISKYQKELIDLEKREEELAKKEKEINERMQTATEHLRNAEAREQVANIAHDNAQKIMDLSMIMPHPDRSQNEAGVI